MNRLYLTGIIIVAGLFVFSDMQARKICRYITTGEETDWANAKADLKEGGTDIVNICDTLEYEIITREIIKYEIVKGDTIKGDTIKEEIKVYEKVEEMPRFPGNDRTMLNWLIENITYPEASKNKNIQGQVFVRFIVKSDGSIEDARIIKSLDEDCDMEALRTITKMPKWIPGKHNGEAVNVYFKLSVFFRK
jgi:TonB family protein